MSKIGKVCAYFRIKPHIPLFLLVPVNSFEFQSCNYTLQAVRLVLTYTYNFFKKKKKANAHSLQQGLQGSLILFTNQAFVFSASVCFVENCLRLRYSY